MPPLATDAVVKEKSRKSQTSNRLKKGGSSSRKGADERPSARKGGVAAEGKPSARKGGAEEKKEAGDSPPAGLSRGKSLKERMAMFGN